MTVNGDLQKCKFFVFAYPAGLMAIFTKLSIMRSLFQPGERTIHQLP
jgi:hypothetical protein